MATKTIERKKTSNISISLPNDVREMAERNAKLQRMTFSGLMLQVLRGYLFKFELDRLNNEIRPGFERLGIHTDDDVEDYLEGLKKKYPNA